MRAALSCYQLQSAKQAGSNYEVDGHDSSFDGIMILNYWSRYGLTSLVIVHALLDLSPF